MWPDGEDRIPPTGDDHFREVTPEVLLSRFTPEVLPSRLEAPEVRPRGANRRLAGFRPQCEALFMRNP